MNLELPDVQAGFRKGRGTRDWIANIHWIIKNTREFQKNIYFCFIDYAKAFLWITTNWKILKEVGIPDHLTSLLRNLYVGQEAKINTGHGTGWFQIGKGVHQGGSKITANGDCSGEIKRRLLLRRKAMTNLGRVLKSRDITLPTKVSIVKATFFSSSHIWMWGLKI